MSIVYNWHASPCRTQDLELHLPIQDIVQVTYTLRTPFLFYSLYDMLSVLYVTLLLYAYCLQTCPIEDESCIDPDVFDSMSSLGCFKDKSVLTKALLSPE